MIKVLATLALLAPLAAHAQVAAPAVPAGCSAPPSIFGHTWVIDAVNGDDLKGDGTAAAPWRTVQSLFQAGAWGGPRYATYPFISEQNGRWGWFPNASGPVKPGDAVELMTGSYGVIYLGVWGQSIINPDWLTIYADPGVTATLAAIQLVDPISKLRFSGLTVRGGAGGMTGPLVLDAGGSDVMFDHLDAGDVEDAARVGWTAAQWNGTVTRDGVSVGAGSSCVTIASNVMHNVKVGFGLAAPAREIVVADNEIHHMIDDAIDIGGDDISVLRNRIHDPINVDGNHEDAVQGFGGPGNTGQYSHIVIDGNRIDRQLDPQNQFALVIQGIDAFDAGWTDVAITRNVISTSSCWGISWGATHGLLIAQNTVSWDGSMTGVSGVSGKWCDPVIAAFTPTHSFPVGDHIVVINNVAQSLVVGEPPAASVASNNVAIGAMSYWTPAGTAYPSAGVYVGNRLLALDPPSGVFASFGRPANRHDLHLCEGSPLIGGGVGAIPAPGDLAAYPKLVLPVADIEGVPFSATAPSVGAFAYQTKPVCTAPTSQ